MSNLVQLGLKGSDIVSAATITLPRNGDRFDVTGTTAISSIQTNGRGPGARFYLQFGGALSLTHSPGLVLRGEMDYLAAPGDVLLFEVSAADSVAQVLLANGPVGDSRTNYAEVDLTSQSSPFSPSADGLAAQVVAFTGTPTGAMNVVLPRPGSWVFANVTPQTLRFLPTDGSLAASPLAAGQTRLVMTDGVSTWYSASLTKVTNSLVDPEGNVFISGSLTDEMNTLDSDLSTFSVAFANVTWIAYPILAGHIVSGVRIRMPEGHRAGHFTVQASNSGGDSDWETIGEVSDLSDADYVGGAVDIPCSPLSSFLYVRVLFLDALDLPMYIQEVEIYE